LLPIAMRPMTHVRMVPRAHLPAGHLVTYVSVLLSFLVPDATFLSQTTTVQLFRAKMVVLVRMNRMATNVYVQVLGQERLVKRW